MSSAHGKYTIVNLPPSLNSIALVVMALSEKHATEIAAAHLGVEPGFLADVAGLKVTYAGSAEFTPGHCRVLQDVPRED